MTWRCNQTLVSIGPMMATRALAPARKSVTSCMWHTKRTSPMAVCCWPKWPWLAERNWGRTSSSQDRLVLPETARLERARSSCPRGALSGGSRLARSSAASLQWNIKISCEVLLCLGGSPNSLGGCEEHQGYGEIPRCINSGPEYDTH